MNKRIITFKFELNTYTVKLSNLMRTKSKSNRTVSNRIESKRNQSNRNEPNRIGSKTGKNFLMLKVLELSELFEPNRIEINRIESNRIEFRVRIKFESFTVLILFILNNQMVN